VRAWAAEGLPYGDRKMTFNSRLAQELASWAVSQPGGESDPRYPFPRVLRRRQKTSATPRSFFKLQRSSGSTKLRRARLIETRTHKAAVDADWEKSREHGVTGVPTYVFGDRGVVGAQPYETLEELVKTA